MAHPIQSLATWWHDMAADVRALQMQALHDSIRTHMGGPSMHYADPGTESLFAQLEAPAEEGAQPASTAGAGLTPTQRAALQDADDDSWLLWLAPVGFFLGVFASWLCVFAK
jgi:hypothetical protein